jgi:hypothetical protein
MSIFVSFDEQSQNIIIQNNSQPISVNINTLNLGSNVLDVQKNEIGRF